MSNERTLVVLAAGIGSRFAGGIKQLQPVGPGGEAIMDFSIYDAMEAGFNRVIFIIRHDLQDLFDEIIGNRIRRVCGERGVEVLCAYQEKTDLPGGFVCPEGRAKPWGTGHALLSCKGMLNGPFAVINADDYYGKDAYQKAIGFLNSLDADSRGTYGLIGFDVENTLSENGGVTRGLCKEDSSSWLLEIKETKNLVKTPTGAGYQTENGMVDVALGTAVSMNMWGFTPDVMDILEERFIRFLNTELNAPKSEFLIPTEVGGMLEEGTAKVKVIHTNSQWFGMTFVEDMPGVRQAFAEMTDKGIYTNPLFN